MANGKKSTKNSKSTKSSKNSKKKLSPVLICVVATAALILVLACAWFFLAGPGSVLFTLPNITAAGIDLEGMDKEQATQALNELADSYASTDMVIQVQDSTVTLTPGEVGAQLDVEAAVEDIFKTSATTTTVDLSPYLQLNTDVIRQTVDALGEEVYSEYAETTYRLEGDDPASGQTLYITMGSPACQLKTDELYNAILTAYYSGEFQVEGVCETKEPEAVDFDSVFKEYYVAPVDAVMDPETFEITEGVPGYGFDTAEAETLLANVQYGETVELAIKEILPAVTAENLWATLFADELSSCSTPHTGDSDRNTNLELACAAINGMILYPGDVFSYNEALGERTPERGYRPGNAYENGEVVLSYGGGICQVSSTLYYCTLIADLEIVERECHMYTPDYIDYGMDATVSWGSLDYKFRNNTNYPIRIDANVSDGYVNISLMGTDDRDYYVEMKYEVVAVYDYEEKYEDYPPDNEKGYYDGQTITWPIVGYGVDTYRCKYSKETGELISEEYEDYSDYDHRDMVICRIVTPQETTPPTVPGADDYFAGSGGGISPDGG